MARRLAALWLAVVVVGAAACGDGDDGVAPEEHEASVWVGRSGLEQVLRLDLQGQEQAVIDVCCEPRDIALADGAVWISTDVGTVVRVDSERDEVEAEIDVGGSAGAIAVGHEHVWVTVDRVDVARISAQTNEVVGRTTVGTDTAPVVSIVVGEADVWALLDFSLAVVRIDPDSGEVADRLQICPAGDCRVGAAATPAGLAADALWVVDATGDELLVVAPEPLEVRERVALPEGAWNVAAGSEGVFLLDRAGGVLDRVDVDDPQTRHRAPAAFQRPTAFTVGAGSVWLHDTGSGELVSVDPRTLMVRTRVPLERVRTVAVG